MEEKLKIIVVDDHEIMRDGLVTLMELEETVEVIGEAGNYQELYELLKKELPKVIIMDIGLPEKSGIEITEELLEKHPEINIIILSANLDEDSIFNAIQAGAKGYLPKDVGKNELFTALSEVSQGKEYFNENISTIIFKNYVKFAKAGQKQPSKKTASLTDREKEILKLLVEGLSYKEIGAKLYISTRTVETHKNNIAEKLELNTKVELVKYAIKNGLADL
jgi:DNA-binding NarL/FixJ family response regulator